jgi:hypothetical protein
MNFTGTELCGVIYEPAHITITASYMCLGESVKITREIDLHPIR